MGGSGWRWSLVDKPTGITSDGAARKKRVVVIGNGMAGVGVVEALLKRKADLAITIFGDEPYTNYNRILLSDVLAGKTTPDKIILNPKEWYQEHQIDLKPAATRIDTESRSVLDITGARTPYDVLVLAVGGLPFVPPIPGREKERVLCFRTMDETHAIIRAARAHRQAIVIGGGLLGLEAARGLINYGTSVTVVHLVDRLMEQQLDTVGASVLKCEIERMGIRVLLNTTVEEILGDETVTGVRLTTGETLPAGMALITTGIRPNLHLALEAGIPCHHGILVDDRMETRIPGIFAVGDVVEHRGKTYGLVAPLRDQAEVIADCMVGEDRRRYAGTVCATTLKVAGINLTSAGDFLGGGGAEEIVYLDTTTALYKKCVVRQNRLVGFILLGDNKDGVRLFNLIQKGEDISRMQSGLLGLTSPTTGGDGALSGVMAMPDSDTICNCNSVTKGTILCAIREKNLTTREAVADCTQATTGCGSCAQLVDDLLAGVKTGGGGNAARPLPPAATPSAEQKATSLKTLDLEKVKQEGLAVDFQQLQEVGTRGLPPEDYYRLKTYGFCSQKHAGYFMLRNRIPGGLLTSKQLHFLANLAEAHGRGAAHLTVRQDLELHFVRVEEALNVFEGLRSVGLTSRSACGHTMRNVMACPHGAIAEDGILDVGPWAQAITDYFVKRSDLINPTMPNRLNIYFSGCAKCAPDAIINDIAFVATKRLTDIGAEEIGFELWLGGSLGAHPILGFKQRDFIPLADALPACQALFHIHTKFGNRNKARSRLKFLIEQWGREKFSAQFEKHFEEKKNLPENRAVSLPMIQHREAHPRPLLRRWESVASRLYTLPDGAMRQRQPGYVYLTVAVPLGEITASHLHAVARIAKRYGHDRIYFTGGQDILLPWIPVRRVSRVIAALSGVGLSLKTRRNGLTLLACPGTEFCVLAVTNAQGAARDILRCFQPDDAEKSVLLNTLSIHISGCPNSCAKHQIGDIGLAGTLTPVGSSRRFSYQLYLGGRIEGGIRLGDMVRKGITDEMIVPTVDALLDIVLSHRAPGESFQEVMTRLTLPKVTALLEEVLLPLAPEEAPALQMIPDLLEVSV